MSLNSVGSCPGYRHPFAVIVTVYITSLQQRGSNLGVLAIISVLHGVLDHLPHLDDVHKLLLRPSYHLVFGGLLLHRDQTHTF